MLKICYLCEKCFVLEIQPHKESSGVAWYADVIVPLALPVLAFSVPQEMLALIQVRSRVVVQLRGAGRDGQRKYYTGIVARLHTEQPPFKQIKPIERVVDPVAVVTAEQLRLWRWLSDYYMCPLGMILRAALPAGLKPVGFSEHETVENGYTPLQENYLRLHPSICSEEQLHQKLESLTRAKIQYKTVLEYLDKAGVSDSGLPGRGIPRRTLSASASILKALTDNGFFEPYQADREEGWHKQPSDRCYESPLLPELSMAQQTAYRAIQAEFIEKEVVLLHGVTGSGKTEIYIRLIAEALEQGSNVLYMLPEIALTAQLIERMERFFAQAVTVYHSRLSDRLRAEIYNRLSQCDGGRLVIGVRSSVLLPLRNLALVIVDEEHDTSFKQTDSAPRYHGRDTAVMLASICGAKTLLGSATPCAESYYNAATGKYGRIILAERYSGVLLPQVIVSDTLRALKRGEKYTHFNKILLDHMTEAVQQNHQVMLFQNRRGFSPYVECGHCGWTGRCPDCNVALTYHKNDAMLRCHYCGYQMSIPNPCPACGGGELLARGFGTEKVEEELAALLPGVSIERLDADTARSPRNYRRIITSFEQHQTDILIGTQIITKGFDFDGVSLVGILNADNLLNFPDFRAGERAFQLIMQVGGRAGRRDRQGTVIIQTSQPDHPIIRQVRDSNYEAMIRSQLAERQHFLYPPFCRLTAIVLRHRDPSLLWRAASAFGQAARGRFGKYILGPEPPPVDRIRGQYRLQFLLKIEKQRSVAAAKQELFLLFEKLHRIPEFKSVDVIVDVDPQ